MASVKYLVDQGSLRCELADRDYQEHRIDYATAVKRCLQTVTDEVNAIHLLSHGGVDLRENLEKQDLPSFVAFVISQRNLLRTS